jgi:hypothetical protein
LVQWSGVASVAVWRDEVRICKSGDYFFFQIIHSILFFIVIGDFYIYIYMTENMYLNI